MLLDVTDASEVQAAVLGILGVQTHVHGKLMCIQMHNGAGAAPTRASSSSRKTMDGAAWRARWKADRSSASPSPTYMENRDAPASATTCAPDAVAAARTSVVLQHPAVSNIALFCVVCNQRMPWHQARIGCRVST